MSNNAKPTPSTRPSLPPRVSSTSSAASSISHQSGVIKEHWNDLPSNFTPGTSRSASRTGTPLSRGEISTPTTTDGASSGGDLEAPDFEEILEALLKAPSKLKPKDVEILGSKVQKSVGLITPEQRAELGFIIKAVVVDRSEGPAWGRENVVAFMMREKGVAGWAIAVRKIVENVV
ncbi:hypothetical protein DFH27DRAFT_86056 [Peziza echinospora]|nr:hypothetical protein DFH27DRAFT_86056 [Peziza echinospora]